MTHDKDIDFAKRADDCAQHAATAPNDRAREVWTKMEQYWRKRAAGVEAPLVPDHLVDQRPLNRDREPVR